MVQPPSGLRAGVTEDIVVTTTNAGIQTLWQDKAITVRGWSNEDE